MADPRPVVVHREWYDGEAKNVHHCRTTTIDSKPLTAEPGWNSVQTRRVKHRITYQDPPRWEQQEREQQAAVQYRGFVVQLKWQTKIEESRSNTSDSDQPMQSQPVLRVEWEDEMTLDFSPYFHGIGNARSFFSNPTPHTPPPPPTPTPTQSSALARPWLQPSSHIHHQPNSYPPYPPSTVPSAPPPRPLPHPQPQPHPWPHHPHQPRVLPPRGGSVYPTAPSSRPTGSISRPIPIPLPFEEESDSDSLFVGPPPAPRGFAATRQHPNYHHQQQQQQQHDPYMSTDFVPPQQQSGMPAKKRAKGKGKSAATPRMTMGFDGFGYGDGEDGEIYG